eukprot:3941754-Rhodomonas_salina.2
MRTTLGTEGAQGTPGDRSWVAKPPPSPLMDRLDSKVGQLVLSVQQCYCPTYWPKQAEAWPIWLVLMVTPTPPSTTTPPSYLSSS